MINKMNTLSKVVLTFIVAGCLFGAYRDINYEWKCLDSRKVVEVQSIFYRGGTVLLEGGMSWEVGQPHESISIGTEICVKSINVRKGEK